ncbi:cell wall hydrolase [Anaerofustis sp. NSJ-163]|uniref:cell wall hydrolase n=1 Tax=Anaerofustis sp. NSJ-163 TaxID=2944391 RepID=UPI00209C43B5|nr:cell wall hydrolase [Anaerofustis sp. NSJ-163]MCO8194618.1 cell wall hydrolase [Anaerofustis sp. NSJ-163]
MAYSDRELLARLIECEAGGEGNEGMAAVASVVMNRVYTPYGEYSRVSNGGSIRNIIYQKGQFTCAMETVNGEYNPQNIYNMNPTNIHYQIADWAISGGRLYNLGYALWFYNPFQNDCRDFFPSEVGSLITKIGRHCFYNPTEKYLQT